jgi:ParB family transcriptional regulator, chromosome partitioning protein
MGSTLMGRNIFNQPAVDVPPSPAPAKPTKIGGSVGGLRESLREITANSIRDIDPEQIEVDGLRDRLAFDDDSIDLLAESIRKHGQQVPIMVRPSGQPDRYRVVYGRRRLAAIRKVGGPVKAIVRTLDDDASLIAQGQENNLRLDPSFIEKALFIKEMQEAGYKPGVIQDALGLTRQGISNHRVVIEQLPDELIRLIGPAHGTGRRQWGELAALASKVALTEVARTSLAALPQDATGVDRFQNVYNACLRAAKSTAKRSAQGRSSTVEAEDGNIVATLSFDAKSIGIKVTRKDNPEFGLWLEERAEAALRDLFHQWRDERGQGN